MFYSPEEMPEFPERTPKDFAWIVGEEMEVATDMLEEYAETTVARLHLHTTVGMTKIACLHDLTQ